MINPPENVLTTTEFHWQLGLLQNLDVGLVVLNADHRVVVWNSFMSNHSGIADPDACGRQLSELFSNFPDEWFRRKLRSVFLLRNRAFITWEERPYLFRFKPHHPITGVAEFMYQNVTLIPLSSPNGQIEHVGIMVYDMTAVAISQHALCAANEELALLSRTDKLSGLSNRGHWESCMRQEYERFRRTQTPSSLVMLDVDHFKKINDTYGHQAGDEVIRTIADMLRQHARNTDLPGRYGGEEFGVLLVNTDEDNAVTFAERVRLAAENMKLRHGPHMIEFTISLGIAQVSNDHQSHEQWIHDADKALYASKHNGRNRTTLAGDLE
ncbi:GGDEF domain-containing protein [Marinobacterium sediminicola]|uniref:diguanylate cyclase n=1 Tax=Marinobacterium sediminicola TaxID=518898 RepID=A0ABY1RWV9_9GAMM|nr:diguanylate cyclase [Marinobacterium sediminicola]ULG70303.1 diguanylate cyclase [Marinobacterium sediminicola]SMR69794.1 diguanylate cyclase (GGDEF) domain-containing protein [Marinobacterium sediminicola]